MQFIAPKSILSAPPEQDLHVIRGDTFTVTMGFLDVPEIAANPDQYRLRVGFRRRQSDTLPFILSRNATLEVNPPDTFAGKTIDIIATVTFNAIETQQLPPAACVYVIEWTDAIGGSNNRVLQGRAYVSD